ncbi:hypothetical protein Tco_0602350 [Tanacetum coccineum]
MPCVTNKLVVCCCKQRVDFRCSGLAVVAASWLPLQWTTPKLLFSILPFTFFILEGEEIFRSGIYCCQDVHLTPFHYGSAAVAAGRLADVAAGRLSLQWIWDDSRRLKPLEIDQVALMTLNEFYRLIVDTMASQ